jgi:hypothetical protein
MAYFTPDANGGFRSEDPRASTLFDKDFGDLSINTAKNIFSHAGGSEFGNIQGYFAVKWLNGNYSGYIIMHYEGLNPVVEKFCIFRPLVGFNLKHVVAYNGKFFAEVLP